jgi:hypothetical protein
MGTDAPRFRLATDAISISRGEALRRAARAVMLGALVMAAVVAMISEGFVMSHFPFFWTTIACLGVSAVAGLTMLLGETVSGRARRGVIELTADTIDVARGDDIRRHRLADLQQGAFREPDGLVLRLRSGLEIRARATRDEAEALLDLAALSAHQRVLRVPVASSASQHRGGEVLGVLGMVLVAPLTFFATTLSGAFVALMLRTSHFPRHGWGIKQTVLVALCVPAGVLGLIAARALAGFLGRREAVVGADGVAVEARGRRTFVPYSAITDVARTKHGVTLGMQNGSHLELPIQARVLAPLPAGAEPAPAGATSREALHRRELLFDRISTALASSNGCVSSAPLDVLDRRTRSVDAWRDALRAQLDRTGTYRGPHLTAEQLLDVVADSRAFPERRIAAAVALSAADDAEQRRRVRIAADACADDDLRAAIERAAEGEIDEPALERMRVRAGSVRGNP